MSHIAILAETMTAPEMTTAGKLITYVIFPLLVLSIMSVIGAAWRGNINARGRAVRLAEHDVRIEGRLDTQDAALARMLEVISPVNSPTLVAVLTRLEANDASQAQRLDDHIRLAEVQAQAIDRRFELMRAGS